MLNIVTIDFHSRLKKKTLNLQKSTSLDTCHNCKAISNFVWLLATVTKKGGVYPKFNSNYISQNTRFRYVLSVVCTSCKDFADPRHL